MPFQVLIPAYLPKFFNREKVEIITDQPGPNGEKMIQLIYSTRKGDTLTLSEWLPVDQSSAKAAANVRRCLCVCQTSATMQYGRDGIECRIGADQS